MKYEIYLCIITTELDLVLKESSTTEVSREMQVSFVCYARGIAHK